MTEPLKPSKTSHGTPVLSRRRKIFFTALIGVLAGTFSLIIAETVLRVAHIPGITYHSYAYDPIDGGTLYPGSRVLYRDLLHDTFISRRVNSWGYLDVEHVLDKPPRTYRVGFFGDSYTEARQVPLNDTFFRRIESDLNRKLREQGLSIPGCQRIETLAFGIAGRSTVQSYLDCGQWIERLGLDCIVYVMYENDPGDQMRAVRNASIFPHAYLQADSFALDYSTRHYFAARNTPFYRMWRRIKSRSLALSTLERRLKLVKQYGIDIPHSDAVENATPLPGSAPSTWWSDSLLAYGGELQSRVIKRWRHEVTSANRTFWILYVPSQWEFEKPPADQDSWIRWVQDFCRAEHITLVDPTAQLVARSSAGERVYYDHLTSAGHEAASAAFVEAFVARHAR